MPRPSATTSSFTRRTLDALSIDDERSFRHVAIYTQLKDVLVRAKYPFRVLPDAWAGRRDRALFLNLTFWNADAGGDVLTDARLDADVVAHVAWHHLAAKNVFVDGEKPSARALFLGESIASAFDVYLVGRLLGHAPKSSFLETQVPAMFDAAADAGMDEDGFEGMLQSIAEDPERAFGDLRALLYDATLALSSCASADEAVTTFATFDAHRFAPLLHHYELSNWVLYARAYAGAPGSETDTRAIEADRALREVDSPVDWLTSRWVEPALG